ncbi:MAG: hypothetical protein ACKVX7_19775 [Planctomycetota bacterium]
MFHRSRNAGWRAVTLAGILACATLAAQTPCPEEPPLNNHLGPGTTAVAGFVAGEQGGAVFQAPAGDYPIEILRVGIGWGSLLGGAPQSLEESVNIYDGVPPSPGAPIAQLLGPVMTDGAINEFNFAPLPGEVVISSGPFLVSLTFANDTPPLFGPSMVHDGAGCIFGRNYVFNSLTGTWQDLCSFGAGGNWVIHVVYRPVNCGPPPADEFKRGECNNDGGIDIADAIFTLSILFTPGSGPAACDDACDSNNDGAVNIADAIALLSSLFGSPAMPLPAPYPGCGEDTGADSLDCEGYANCP